jgi:APA family basic amino acid/polyamine antiporter
MDSLRSGLVRQLGLFDSTMVVVGVVIGSGIFLTTGIMARHIPSASLILLAWLTGGLLTVAGALTYAELGAAMPEAGGQYVYLREAYGRLAGFLFGWILFLVYMTGGIAGLALALAEYLGHFFPALGTGHVLLELNVSFFQGAIRLSLSAGQIVGVLVIAVLSVFHFIGVGLGKSIQNLFTVIKLGILVATITLGLAVGKGTPPEFALNTAGTSWGNLIVGFGISLVAVAWAFDGWNNVNFVAGEIKKPGTSLPLALALGTLGITLLYVLVNYIYLYALPMNEIVGVVRIAEKSVVALFGSSYGHVISALVIVSVFGALNGSILVGSRVYYAMARDGLFFRRVAGVHPRFRTPGFSILIQAIWASLLTIFGTFEQIFTFAMFMGIVFWIAATASVFTLRKKRPEMPRPYKTWGYPVVPAIFILASLGILINTLLEKPAEAMAGILLTVLGWPVFRYWNRRSKIKKLTIPSGNGEQYD